MPWLENLTPSGALPGPLPNERLKLAGAIVLKEAECCGPGGPRTPSHTLAPAGESPAA